MTDNSIESFDDFDSDGTKVPQTTENIQQSGVNAFDDDDNDLIEDLKNGERTDQAGLLDDKDEQEAKEKRKEKKKEEDEDGEDDDEEENDDEEEEEDGEEEEDDDEDIRSVKHSKAKFNDKTIDVPDEATFGVTVDGKKEFVPLSELKGNYSGKISFDKKFADINRENLKIKATSEKIETDKNELMTYVTKIRDLMVDDSGKISPFAAVEYICNLTGVSAFDYNKRMFEHYAPLSEKLLTGSDEEVHAYWTSLENQYLKSNQAADAEKRKGLDTHKERELNFKKQLESLGVSEEDFSISAQELKSLGITDFDERNVIQYMKVKPLYELADDVSSKYKDLFTKEDYEKLQDDLVKHMEEEPNEANKESLVQILSVICEDTELLIDDLERKVLPKKKVKSKKKKKTGDRVESFDDFDLDY